VAVALSLSAILLKPGMPFSRSFRTTAENPLETYAAKNSNVAKEKSSAAKLENAKPLYLLGEKIVTTSTSKDKRTLTCSGGISVSVGDMKASKEVNFTVQQKSDGKLSVSVAPFEF
jgi:hypothetical protein